MNRKVIYTIAAITFLIGFVIQPAQASRVTGYLSNFDVYNFTNDTVDAFELILVDVDGNPLNCNDATYYPGWGTVGGIPTDGCQQLNDTTIRPRWGGDPIPPGGVVHMGIGLPGDGSTVRAIMAEWWCDNSCGSTGMKAKVSFLWQRWDGTYDCPVGDIVEPQIDSSGYETFPPWTIQREWAYSPTVIPLGNLTRTDPLVQALPWNTLSQEIVTWGTPAVFYTPPMAGSGGLVFRYPVVTIQGDTAVYFTNEAVLGSWDVIPTLTEWGLIIFAVLLIGWMAWTIVRRRKAARLRI